MLLIAALLIYNYTKSKHLVLPHHNLRPNCISCASATACELTRIYASTGQEATHS